MSLFIRNGKRIDPFRPFKAPNGKTYDNLRDPALREQFGVTEIPDPTPPADFSDDIYYVTHQDEAPYVIWTRKSDEQINQAKNARIQQQIDAEERNAMLPRVAREFMLGFMEANATPEQLEANIGYKRVKELDTKIGDLRRSKV